MTLFITVDNETEERNNCSIEQAIAEAIEINDQCGSGVEVSDVLGVTVAFIGRDGSVRIYR